MEIKIEDLVASIKKDGIDAADEQAAVILGNAEKQAAQIIADAKAEQERILKETQEKTDLLTQSAKTSILQAKRDALLLFEDAVQKKFEKILAADIRKSVSGEALVRLIQAAINGENPADYTVLVTEITEEMKSELAREIKDGLEIKISPAVKSGFRLNVKDGSGYFDCSEDEIVEMLAPFLPEIEI